MVFKKSTRFSKKTTRRPKARFTAKRRLGAALVRKTVRSEMNRQEEIKQSFNFYGIASPAMLNDCIYTTAPLQSVAQGTGDSNRIGNQIYLKNLHLRMTFSGALASLNARFRVMVLWLDKQVSIPAISATNAGVINTDLFFGNYRLVNALINNKLEHKVIYDKVINIESKNTSIPQGLLDVRVPLNTKVTYLTAGGVFTKEKQLYVCWMPSIPFATSGVASAWQVNIDQLLTYKDS